MVQLQQCGIGIRPVVHGHRFRVRRDGKHPHGFQHPLVLELVTHRVRQVQKHPGPCAAEHGADDVDRDALADLQAAPDGSLFT